MSSVIVFIVIGAILAFAVLQIVMGGKSKKEQAAKKKELYRKAYKILSRNFITQRSIRNIV